MMFHANTSEKYIQQLRKDEPSAYKKLVKLIEELKIHPEIGTGKVCVAPDLPFGGDNCNAIKASGVFGKASDRIWLPVSAYLIEHPKGLILVDTC